MSSPTTSSQASVTFDFSRVLQMQQYNNLETIADTTSFTHTVRDYMAYARSLPVDHVLTAEEEIVATTFANAIRSRKAWPLARQVTSEFLNPPTFHDLQNMPAPLRHAIKAVVDEGLLQLRNDETRTTQQLQEDFRWQNMQAHIRYIGYYWGIAEATPPERRQEVENTIAMLGEIVRRFGLPPDDSDRLHDLDSEEDDMEEEESEEDDSDEEDLDAEDLEEEGRHGQARPA